MSKYNKSSIIITNNIAKIFNEFELEIKFPTQISYKIPKNIIIIDKIEVPNFPKNQLFPLGKIPNSKIIYQFYPIFQNFINNFKKISKNPIPIEYTSNNIPNTNIPISHQLTINKIQFYDPKKLILMIQSLCNYSLSNIYTSLFHNHLTIHSNMIHTPISNREETAASKREQKKLAAKRNSDQMDRTQEYKLSKTDIDDESIQSEYLEIMETSEKIDKKANIEELKSTIEQLIIDQQELLGDINLAEMALLNLNSRSNYFYQYHIYITIYNLEKSNVNDIRIASKQGELDELYMMKIENTEAFAQQRENQRLIKDTSMKEYMTGFETTNLNNTQKMRVEQIAKKSIYKCKIERVIWLNYTISMASKPQKCPSMSLKISTGQ